MVRHVRINHLSNLPKQFYFATNVSDLSMHVRCVALFDNFCEIDYDPLNSRLAWLDAFQERLYKLWKQSVSISPPVASAQPICPLSREGKGNNSKPGRLFFVETAIHKPIA